VRQERERKTGDWWARRGLWAAEQGQQMGMRRERRGGSDLGLGESCVCVGLQQQMMRFGETIEYIKYQNDAILK